MVSGQPYAVCVYCSASTADHDQLALAARVGTEIASRGWQLVSGGGHVSMMGAVATAARAGGANTIGVIPKHLVHREVADVDSDELVVTDTMRQRKQMMEDRADAFLTLPGGIGTLEEFFETWTGAYLGVHNKPVVVLDPDGHYRGLFDWVNELYGRGFVSQLAMDRVTVTTDLATAFDALQGVSAGSHSAGGHCVSDTPTPEASPGQQGTTTEATAAAETAGAQTGTFAAARAADGEADQIAVVRSRRMEIETEVWIESAGADPAAAQLAPSAAESDENTGVVAAEPGSSPADRKPGSAGPPADEGDSAADG